LKKNDQKQVDISYSKPAGRSRKRKLDASAGLPCQSISDLQAQFREQWEHNQEQLIPEKLNAEFTFDGTATIAATELTDEIRSAYGMALAAQTGAFDIPIRIDVRAALLPVSDAQLKRNRQRAVCKEIVRGFSAIDGYHYGGTRSVDSFAGNGFRFKFVCSDSFENIERAANKWRKKAPANAEGDDDSDSESKKAPDAKKKGSAKGMSQELLSKLRFKVIQCQHDV
jgi:hypothetical protein